MYICKHFKIHELVPPKVFEERGERAWELLDSRALEILDTLREKYGPMTINNYKWGGNRQWSGLRTPDSSYFRPYSQHVFGRAFDCLFAETTAEKVRQDILDHDFGLEGINSIELGTSWLHFDVRNCKPIKTYKP